MKVGELLAGAQDTLSVRRVFGDPLEKDGVTVIPAAKVSGGGGGGKVSWQPAFDLNRLILGCQMVAVVAILAGILAKRR